MNDKCWAKYVEMYLDIKKDGEIYVYFSFCCEQQIRIAEYPIEYLCNNLDKCYNDVLDKAADLQICYDCHKYDGFDIYDKSLFSLQNGTHHICTQGCKFCGIVITGKRIKDPKYRWCSNKILEAVSKSKTIEKFAPSVSGEPFEDPYIKNEFLFSLHNSNIKHVNILTNALHCDREYLERLHKYSKEHGIIMIFTINCSGFTKEIYESYCTGKFETVKQNIKDIYEVFKDDGYININYITSRHNGHLTRDEIYQQYKEAFPFLSESNLRKSTDYCIWGEKKEKIVSNIYKEDDRDNIKTISFVNNGKISKLDIYRRYNRIMNAHKYDNKCLDNSLQLFIQLEKGTNRPFISFVFCCQMQIELMKYPLEDVCKDFDKYFLQCVEILHKGKFCSKCNHFSEFDTSDPKEYIVTNGTNFVCTQKCTYCGSCDNVADPSIYTQYSNKLMEAISKSKHVFKVVPSCQGEPFEDKYIRNEFLFNLHNSGIKYIRFLTNGAHATKSYIDKLSKYFNENGIECSFLINCSGFNKETYESYCTTKFDKIKQNIENLTKTFGKENITILYIISKHNYLIEKEDVIKQFKESFPYLDPNENLSIIMDWKNWTDSERLKLNAKFCDKQDNSVAYNLSKYCCNSYYMQRNKG